MPQTARVADSVEQSRVEAWERRSEWPLAILAVVFLLAYSLDVLDTSLSSGTRDLLRGVDYVVWLLFVVDYAGRITVAAHRLRYVWRHKIDMAIIVLPVLRPLRLLRLVMLLRILNRRATDSMRGRVITYVVGSALVLVYCASLAVLDAERHHDGANITTFGDALWWSATTVTTVGYGDRYPVTTEGRFVAAGLMVGGIALIGAVSASFATWLIDRVREVEEDAETATRADLRGLREQLDRIERRLDTSGAATERAQPGRDRLSAG
jgi:voltage-gated potassium channel